MTAKRLAVIGAGPAGMGAAISAAACGLDVTVLDFFDQPGGQVYRALSPGLQPKGRQPSDFRKGEKLRAAFARTPMRYLPRHTVWNVSSGLEIDAIGPSGPVTVTTDMLVIASGAMERVVPFPGWTNSRVMGLAAATILFKADRVAPGKRVIVAGRGPLLAAVAHSVVDAGGTVVAIVDANTAADWLKNATRMLARPDQLAKGLGWSARLVAARVPVLFDHRVGSAEPLGDSVRVTAIPATDPGPQRHFEADVLCVGDGLMPETALPRMLGLTMTIDRLLGGFAPIVDVFGRSDRPGIFVAGDAAGIGGALAAFERGRLAGLAAAHDLGVLSSTDFRRRSMGPRLALAVAETFVGASRRLMAVSEDEYASLPDDVTACRCEDVTIADIDRAIGDGASDMNQVKAWTRAGMGPCQGRNCQATVAARLERSGTPKKVLTARGPLRPVPVTALVGDFEYDEIPGVKDASRLAEQIASWR